MPSFNVQNAKSLEITEGDVATIHDADGRQLWGKLNYTTKYGGDTTQQNYTGKNLLNFKKFLTDRNVTYTEDADGSITFTLTNQLNSNKLVFSETDITVSIQAEITNITSSNTYIQLYNQNNVRVARLSAANPKAENVSACSMNMDWQSSGSVTIKNAQLETGSTATAYEPYVGGIPSPNPDYPQPVNVVTGTQTITLTGGTVSKDYTVGLGSIELCKISTYQDYIWKDGSDWKIHKAIGKVVLNGTEDSLVYNSTYSGFRYTNDDFDISDSNPSNDLVCSHFSIATARGTEQPSPGIKAYTNINDKRYIFLCNGTTDVNNFKTWLSTHNTTVYYHRLTATDTQISDATLISQLEAVEEFLRRYGYTSTVAGNLPIIIDRDTL